MIDWLYRNQENIMKQSLTVLCICAAIICIATVLLKPDRNYRAMENTHPYAHAEFMMGMR